MIAQNVTILAQHREVKCEAMIHTEFYLGWLELRRKSFKDCFNWNLQTQRIKTII